MTDDTTPVPPEDEADEANRSEEPGSTPASPDDDAATPEPEVFTRVCRRCSAQATTASDSCPACGARYARRRPSKKRMFAFAAVLVLLAGSGITWAVLDKRADDRRERERIAQVKAEREKAEREEEEAAEAAAEAEETEAAVLKMMRESYVHGLRKEITKHAQNAYNDGLLESRANGSSCDNTDGNEVDPDATGAAYSCMAITKRNSDGTSSGYRYSGRVNYDEGTYTWQLGD